MGSARRERSDRGALRWRGEFARQSPAVRAMAFAVIAVSEVSLTFAQLGFLGIGPAGSYATYAVVLLAPVALGALLYGALGGTALGLVAGAALLAHSIAQPLDFYEVFFITPFSSVVLFTITGFVLGLLFAFVLRRAERPGLRAIAIAVVCVIGAVAFGLAFRANVMYETIARSLADSLGFSEIDEDAALMVSAFGSFGLQTIIDAVVMVAVCVAAEFVVRRIDATAANRSLLTTFRAWLFGVVLIAFMSTAAVSFAVITEQERAVASASMGDEAAYLCRQIDQHEERLAAFDEIAAGSDGSSEVLDNLRASLSIDTLLDGYSVEFDGYVYVIKGDTILLSDDAGTPAGGAVVDYFGEGAHEWFAETAQTGALSQLLYDSTANPDGSAADDADGDRASLQIVYMRVAQTGDYSVLVSMPASMVFAARGGGMMGTTLLAVVLLAAVFFMASRLLASVVVRRIDETNAVLARIEEGDLAARANVRDSREFTSLSHGINSTVEALESWIAEAESRIDAELAAAKSIQEAALPRIFPPFPDILRFDVYASMEPAKEVGGDFYDFFLIGAPSEGEEADEASAASAYRINSGKLGFLIADVSGKSVPAALFMMAAKSQIRTFMESGMELGEAFENANRRLCEGNDAGMFVTVFAGVLDYATGRIVYVNAGHNPPLLWQDGSWRLLKETSGLPLGLFDGLPYKAFECTCEIGDELLLYTDGVTEAMSATGELYGLDRLEALVKDCFTFHPHQLIDAVRDDVAAFSAGAEQADDITMLALEYGVPPEVTSTIVVPADDAQLPRVTEFVHTELDRRACPVRAQNQLDIALEELFVNVAHYAYPDAAPGEPKDVRVSYTYSAEPPSITVEIADDGIPFDPLAKPDAVTPDNIFDVQIGGLGILMAKKSVDEMRYARVDGSNVVTIVKRW